MIKKYIVFRYHPLSFLYKCDHRFSAEGEYIDLYLFDDLTIDSDVFGLSMVTDQVLMIFLDLLLHISNEGSVI